MTSSVAIKPPLSSASLQARRTARARVLKRLGLQLVTVLIVLAIYEILVYSGALPVDSFPHLGSIVVAGVKFWLDGSGAVAVGGTLAGWAAGLALATVLAVPLGILTGWFSGVQRAVLGIADFLRPVPGVAILPVAVLILGIGIETKVFLVFFSAFWPIWFQSMYGVRGMDPVLKDTARSYRIPRAAFFFRVVLPSTAPFIATGIRISSGIALILAIVAELIIGMPGLGSAITLARTNGALDTMYSLVIMTGLVGWGLNTLFLLIEHRLLSWHSSNRPS